METRTLGTSGIMRRFCSKRVHGPHCPQSVCSAFNTGFQLHIIISLLSISKLRNVCCVRRNCSTLFALILCKSIFVPFHCRMVSLCISWTVFVLQRRFYGLDLAFHSLLRFLLMMCPGRHVVKLAPLGSFHPSAVNNKGLSNPSVPLPMVS